MKKIIRKTKNNCLATYAFRRVLIFLISNIFWLLLLFVALNANADNVQFIQEDGLELTSGHIRLDWVSDETEYFELQQATNQGFENAKTIYKGPDKASFISGLTNGTYYFRIKPREGEWTDQLKVIVKYQSLELAFSLFTMGAVVFILTSIVIIKGTLTYKTES